jgi:serine/threonine protein kinase
MPFGATYRIERELGRGGMATVFLAEDLSTTGRSRSRRCMSTSQAFSGLSDSCGKSKLPPICSIPILRAFDSGAAGDILYYVRPFVEGETFGCGSREGRFIRPENTMLPGNVAKVADFGLDKPTETDAGPLSARDNVNRGGFHATPACHASASSASSHQLP